MDRDYNFDFVKASNTLKKQLNIVTSNFQRVVTKKEGKHYNYLIFSTLTLFFQYRKNYLGFIVPTEWRATNSW